MVTNLLADGCLQLPEWPALALPVTSGRFPVAVKIPVRSPEAGLKNAYNSKKRNRLAWISAALETACLAGMREERRGVIVDLGPRAPFTPGGWLDDPRTTFSRLIRETSDRYDGQHGTGRSRVMRRRLNNHQQFKRQSARGGPWLAPERSIASGYLGSFSTFGDVGRASAWWSLSWRDCSFDCWSERVLSNSALASSFRPTD